MPPTAQRAFLFDRARLWCQDSAGRVHAYDPERHRLRPILQMNHNILEVVQQDDRFHISTHDNRVLTYELSTARIVQEQRLPGHLHIRHLAKRHYVDGGRTAYFQDLNGVVYSVTMSPFSSVRLPEIRGRIANVVTVGDYHLFRCDTRYVYVWDAGKSRLVSRFFFPGPYGIAQERGHDLIYLIKMGVLPRVKQRRNWRKLASARYAIGHIDPASMQLVRYR